jgi:hypothetical protein
VSKPLALRDLDAALRQCGTAAYVLTVGERGAPHVVYAEVTREATGLVAVVGAHTADNARRRPHVSLLYPPRDSADYSLIIDAVAEVESTVAGPRLRVAPTRAVLHRPGPAPDPASSSCGSDCVPLPLGELEGTPPR